MYSKVSTNSLCYYNDIRKLFQEQGHTKPAKSPIFKILEQQCTMYENICSFGFKKKISRLKISKHEKSHKRIQLIIYGSEARYGNF